MSREEEGVQWQSTFLQNRQKVKLWSFLDTPSDAPEHIFSNVTWGPQVFQVFQHQKPSSRRPCCSWSDHGVCSGGIYFSPLAFSPDPEPSRGFFSCFSDVFDGSCPCSSCDARGLLLGSLLSSSFVPPFGCSLALTKAIARVVLHSRLHRHLAEKSFWIGGSALNSLLSGSRPLQPISTPKPPYLTSRWVSGSSRVSWAAMGSTCRLLLRADQVAILLCTKSSASWLRWPTALPKGGAAPRWLPCATSWGTLARVGFCRSSLPSGSWCRLSEQVSSPLHQTSPETYDDVSHCLRTFLALCRRSHWTESKLLSCRPVATWFEPCPGRDLGGSWLSLVSPE